VVCAQHIMSNPDNDYNTEMVFGRLPEAIGARGCKITCMTSSGGASSFSLRKTAEGILHSGETDTVLVVHAQRFSTFTRTTRRSISPSPARTWSGRCHMA